MENIEPKYDEVTFLTNDDCNFISLEILIDIYNKNNQLYINTYYNQIYCPECHKAKLNLIHMKNDKFCLRAFPKQKHGDLCSKQLPLVSNSVFKKYCEAKDSVEHINRRLHQLIDMVLKKATISSNPQVIRTINGKCSDDEVMKQEISNHTYLKAIPIKSLTTPFHDDDYNVWKIFYGKVNIKWDKTDYSYNLKCYHPTKNYLICRISVSNKIYDYYLPDEYKQDRINIFIAFAGNIQRKEYNGKLYNNSILRFSHYLVIK